MGDRREREGEGGGSEHIPLYVAGNTFVSKVVTHGKGMS